MAKGLDVRYMRSDSSFLRQISTYWSDRTDFGGRTANNSARVALQQRRNSELDLEIGGELAGVPRNDALHLARRALQAAASDLHGVG